MARIFASNFENPKIGHTWASDARHARRETTRLRSSSASAALLRRGDRIAGRCAAFNIIKIEFEIWFIHKARVFILPETTWNKAAFFYHI